MGRSVVAIAALVSSLALAQQDAVSGAGTAGTGTFALSALSGPSGENASGTFSFDLAIGSFQGTVTCLNVAGSDATLGGMVTSGTGSVPEGTGVIIHVRDNGVSGANPDLLRLELVGFVPSTCPATDLLSASAVTQGDIVVSDAAMPGATVAALITHVESLGLPQGTETALLAKLYAASDAIADGRINAACNQLRAFINQVQAQSGKDITPADASSLVSEAEAIRAQLGCP